MSTQPRTSLIKQQEELTQQSQTIVSDLKQLNKAKQTLRKINNREIELLKSKTTAPKQNIATRTLKTAAGLIAGATIGALKGSGSAIKTGGKAMLNASSGIRNTYEMNRNNIPKSTKQNQR